MFVIMISCSTKVGTLRFRLRKQFNCIVYAIGTKQKLTGDQIHDCAYNIRISDMLRFAIEGRCIMGKLLCVATMLNHRYASYRKRGHSVIAYSDKEAVNCTFDNKYSINTLTTCMF